MYTSLEWPSKQIKEQAYNIINFKRCAEAQTDLRPVQCKYLVFRRFTKAAIEKSVVKYSENGKKYPFGADKTSAPKHC